MERYEFKEELGSGRFGVVSKYYDTLSHQDVAIKVVSIPNKFDASILREVSILKELDHENIVKLLDLHEDGTNLYLVFEYLDGELASELPTLTPSQIKRIMHGLLSGLDNLHSQNIIHRDFCPTNVLVKKHIDEFGSVSTYTMKISDFGLSRYTGRQKEGYTHTECTYEYTSPEQLLRAPTYSTPVDIWAAGCMFAEMVNKDHLFCYNRELASIAHISTILGPPNEKNWPGLSSFAPTFSSLDYIRPKGLRAAVEKLDSDGLDLLAKMLVWDPSQRITASEALQHQYFNDLAS